MGYGLVMGRGEKVYFAVPAQTLLGGTSYWDDRPPKRGKFEGEPLGACLESRERKYLYCDRKKCYGIQRNKTNLPLSGKGECHTDLVVGKYSQTRQRQLRSKTVKPWSRQAL